MLAADADLIVFADADMATPPDQLPLLVAALADHDVSLGSRIQPDGSDMRATQPGYRRLLGKVFHCLASIWVVGPVQDTQCGFKGFTRAAAHDLFARQKVTSIVFDVELIYLARRRGYRMAIVPIRWYDKRGSRMRASPGLAAAGRLGPVPDPAHPSRQRAGREIQDVMDQPALARLGRAALPIVAILVFVVVVGASVYAAGDTLGFDFLAYHQAAVRLLNGQPLYDMSFQTTGGFGLFYYPPTFAPLILPFGLLSATTAVWAWTAILIGSFAVGVAVLPVSRTVRWWIVLLAGLSWPFAYAVKLGQVGPILFLLFAIGWRWLDDPIRLGASAALGTAIKLQPGILFVWADPHPTVGGGRGRGGRAGGPRRRRDARSPGPAPGRISRRSSGRSATRSRPPHNFTPGAVAYQLGLSAELASLIQLACTVARHRRRRRGRAAGRPPRPRTSSRSSPASCCRRSCGTTTRCCCCCRSPISAPPAAGGRSLIPLVTAVPLIGITPAIVYPLAFAVALGATLGVGHPGAPGGRRVTSA